METTAGISGFRCGMTSPRQSRAQAISSIRDVYKGGAGKKTCSPFPSFCRYPFRKAGFLPYISPLLLKSQDKALQCFYPECFHALVLAHTEGFPQSENVTAFREVGIRLPTWRKTQFATKWGIRLPHFLAWSFHELRIRLRSCVYGGVCKHINACCP